ncbi:MAG: hypothetical protein KJ626_02365 [Verrucomicrobia bacterium]|nr:hypothetical protein [Verrucomicrobiota bacterium]
MNEPKRRSRLSAAWIVAGVITVAWHAFWFMWLSPEPVAASVEPVQVPDFRYLPAGSFAPSGEGRVAELRGMWSADLFSLPSLVGFSRPLLIIRIGARPPLESPVDAKVLLPREEKRTADVGAIEELDLLAGVSDQLTSLDSDLNYFDGFNAESPTGSFLRVECIAGLSPDELAAVELPTPAIFTNQIPLDFIAVVEFDDTGAVRHALLERGSDDGRLNGLMLRSIYQWRMPPSEVERRGTVRISYVPGEAQNGGFASVP